MIFLSGLANERNGIVLAQTKLPRYFASTHEHCLSKQRDWSHQPHRSEQPPLPNSNAVARQSATTQAEDDWDPTFAAKDIAALTDGKGSGLVRTRNGQDDGG